MVRLLARVAAVARRINPYFLLIPLNVSDLVEVPEFLQIVDGISQEAIWFDGTVGDNPPGDCPLPRFTSEMRSPRYFSKLTPACLRAYREGRAEILDYAHEEYVVPRFQAARAARLAVFNIEYVLHLENIAEIVHRSRSLEFKPFVAARSLADYLPPAY